MPTRCMGCTMIYNIPGTRHADYIRSIFYQVKYAMLWTTD